MTRTVFPFTSPEIAFWISVSLSTSRDAVASSNRMTGASFKSARAMVSPLSNLFQFFHNKSKQLCLFPPSQKTDRHKMPLSTVPSQNFHLQNKYHFLHCLYETKSALFQPVENQHCSGISLTMPHPYSPSLRYRFTHANTSCFLGIASPHGR